MRVQGAIRPEISLPEYARELVHDAVSGLRTIAGREEADGATRPA
ncbi:hypothetical protein [Actinomadura rudentiformis]|nr:hypothetical protein [Actinomadura rudentiformis]